MFGKKIETVDEEVISTIKIPAIRGELKSVVNWNTGTIAVVTSYGVYSVYRNQERQEVELVAVFTDGK